MSLRLAKPYVDALFEVAGSSDAVEPLLTPLQAFSGALLSSDELRSVLLNPALDRETKKALLQAVAEKAGVPPLGGRLLEVLLQNHRLTRLPDMLAALRERLDRERRVVEATLKTATPADEATVRGIRTTLEREGRRKVRLVALVDASLIGGFVVTLGSEVYDASLVHRLERARQALHTGPSLQEAGREGKA